MATTEGVDVVLHLAALIAIPFSYVAPRSYVETNVIGTLNVLEAVRRHGTPRMVNTSTSEVYGTPESVPITEAHPLRGQSPYSRDEDLGRQDVRVVRPVVRDAGDDAAARSTRSVRDSPTRAVIPTVLSQLLAGASQLKLGDLTPKRDFTFVTDTGRRLRPRGPGRRRARHDDPARHRPHRLGRRRRRAVPQGHRQRRRDRHRERPHPPRGIRGADPAVRPDAAPTRCSAGRPPCRSRRACGDGRVAAAAGRPRDGRAVPPVTRSGPR